MFFQNLLRINLWVAIKATHKATSEFYDYFDKASEMVKYMDDRLYLFFLNL